MMHADSWKDKTLKPGRQAGKRGHNEERVVAEGMESRELWQRTRNSRTEKLTEREQFLVNRLLMQ